MDILLADSGATKTDWIHVSSGSMFRFRTRGLNPFPAEPGRAAREILEAWAEERPGDMPNPDVASLDIRFYGAGVAEDAGRAEMERFLCEAFVSGGVAQTATVRVHNDIDAAAQAAFPDSEGIVMILGTGTILARVRDGRVVDRVPALGVMIGDEGSAAALGREIYRHVYRRLWPDPIVALAVERAGLADYGAQMRTLYRSDRPGYLLAMCASNVLAFPLPPEFETLIRTEMSRALDLLPLLTDRRDLPVYLSGGAANAHRAILEPLVRAAFPAAELRFSPSILEDLASRIRP
jgi:N-acetylglucosamine kinase-like BadF-type ATPase